MSIEAVEQLVLKEKTLTQTVAEISPVPPAEETRAEPAKIEAPQVLPVASAEENAAPKIATPRRSIASVVASTSTATKAAEAPKAPESSAPDAPACKVIDSKEERRRLFEASLKLANRSYKNGASEGNALDLDVGIKGEHSLSERLNIEAHAELAALNLKQPSGSTDGAPRPFALGADLKYLLSDDNRLRLSAVGGFLYRTAWGARSVPTYSNVYSPVLGLDALWSLDAAARILFAPRFSWIGSGSYGFELPVTYYWDERFGANLSYSHLVITPSGGAQNSFQTISGGVVLKF
jgi:hypothetical protein